MLSTGQPLQADVPPVPSHRPSPGHVPTCTKDEDEEEGEEEEAMDCDLNDSLGGGGADGEEEEEEEDEGGITCESEFCSVVDEDKTGGDLIELWLGEVVLLVYVFGRLDTGTGTGTGLGERLIAVTTVIVGTGRCSPRDFA